MTEEGGESTLRSWIGSRVSGLLQDELVGMVRYEGKGSLYSVTTS